MKAEVAPGGRARVHSSRFRPASPLSGSGWVEFYSEDSSLRLYLRARFGEQTIVPTGGGAGWKSVPRPQRRPLTVWEGPPEALSMPLDLIFDGLLDDSEGRSIESDMAVLDRMAGVNQPGDPQPPLLILDAGGALPHDYTRNPSGVWVIQPEPVLGEAIRRGSDGDRVRQQATVTFMLYTADERLNRAKKPTPSRTVRARAGDTYEKIAARELGQYGGRRLGNRLAQFNGARDGAQQLQVGQLVKLPSIEEVKTWATTPRR